MKHIVGVYGTLRKGLGLSGYLDGSDYVETLEIKNPLWRLVDLGPFPAVIHRTWERDENNHHIPKTFPITFELYYVDEDTLSLLDDVEGVPSLYRRESYLARTRFGLRPMYYYVYQNGTDDAELIHSGDYVKYLSEKRELFDDIAV